MAQLILVDRMRKQQGTEAGFRFDVGTSHDLSLRPLISTI